MKLTSQTLLRAALLVLPLGLVAQTTTTTTTSRTYSGDGSDWGPQAGAFELTLGGSGLSNNDLNNSSGGINASLGYYLNDTLEFSVRQTISYANPSGGDSSWAGITRVALDQHILPSGAIRPFVGINFGGVYGEDVTETWLAGLEAGAKFYVKESTFIFAMVDYAWTFKDSDDADDTFSDGAFTWTIGIGFNF